MTLCNLNPNEPATVNCRMDAALKTISGRVLTAPEMNAHNTFENPDTVRLLSFGDATLTADGFTATLPPKSVVALELK